MKWRLTTVLCLIHLTARNLLEQTLKPDYSKPDLSDFVDCALAE